MIKAHNIRNAILGALVFITVGSFGACSTDLTGPGTDAMEAPAPAAPTATAAVDGSQTIDGTTAPTPNAGTTDTNERCVIINGLWFCTGQG